MARSMTRLAAAVCWLGLAAPSVPVPVSARASDLPATIVWAWERPEDLRWLDARAGVAFLAQTISLDGRGPTVVPRRQPLRVRDSTDLVAVTRIEMSPRGGITERDLAQVAGIIAATSRLPNVRGIQVDFDATASQRAWYRLLLGELRSRLPADMPLSMTALASWCVGDAWLHGLPADEVVPMLFDLGPVNQPYAEIGVSPGAAVPECRSAVGLSIDDRVAARPRGRRVYLFSARPWTPASFADALTGADQ